jgi:hypothetical protein
MRIGTVLGIMTLTAIGAGYLSAQGLGVKTGEWETTTNMSGLGGGTAAVPQLPPGALDRLPPEQRARIEAQLKAAGGGARSNSTKHCITQDDVSKGFHPSNVPASCSYTLQVSTPTQQKMAVTCDNDKAKSTGTIQVDVVDPQTLKGSIQMATAANGQTMNTNITFTSKWLGPACTEKPGN